MCLSFSSGRSEHRFYPLTPRSRLPSFSSGMTSRQEEQMAEETAFAGVLEEGRLSSDEERDVEPS